MKQTAIGLVIALCLVLAVKYLILPMLSSLGIDGLRSMPTRDLLLLLEVVAVTIVLGGFVVEELLVLLHRVRDPHQPAHGAGARWGDAAFVFAIAFGSAALFIGFMQFAH